VVGLGVVGVSMVGFGWLVLTLVFVDELLAVAAFGVWGWQQDPRWLLVWLLPVAAMTAWFFFASPKARWGGRLRRPLVKVVVFGLATLALWDAGHPELAVGLLTFSVVVNALAQIPAISALPEAA
jgi:hypothetical protein